MHRISLVFLLFAAVLSAQQSATPSVAQEDPFDEIGKLKKNCPFAHVLGCAEVLFTGEPLHIAVGTIAPQNGFSTGLALVGHRNETSGDWRISWNADAVASANGSWRAGVYVRFVDTSMAPAVPEFGTTHARPSGFPVYTEQPVINLYEQTISLNKLTFFGLGPTSGESGRSYYGMTEHVVGASAFRPIWQRLNAGVYGELNGRVVDIRPDRNESSPSIEQLYTTATAPGMDRQRSFLQLGGGVRMRPSAFNNLLHFNYDLAYRPFFAVSDSKSSFQRMTIDLDQEISLHRGSMRVPRETNGPDDCAIDPTADSRACPKAGIRAQEGTFGLRIFSSLSLTPGGDIVPFYFQPTLGGADINGNPSLPSYQDYRFRAPNLLLIRENFEHSIGRLPLGIALMADQSKLGITRGDIGVSPWLRSYAAGITLRAGGFPQVYLLFAFGGKEGTHTLLNVNASLLGTSGRPSLY